MTTCHYLRAHGKAMEAHESFFDRSTIMSLSPVGGQRKHSKTSLHDKFDPNWSAIEGTSIGFAFCQLPPSRRFKTNIHLPDTMDLPYQYGKTMTPAAWRWLRHAAAAVELMARKYMAQGVGCTSLESPKFFATRRKLKMMVFSKAGTNPNISPQRRKETFIGSNIHFPGPSSPAVSHLPNTADLVHLAGVSGKKTDGKQLFKPFTQGNPPISINPRPYGHPLQLPWHLHQMLGLVLTL